MADKNPGQSSGPLQIDGGLAQRLKDEIGQNAYLCYQCVKCTSGCPVAEFFDWQPNQILRAVQLGQEDLVFEAESPWLCASCQTCTTRCPQSLDITAIMEFLTREALARGYRPKIPAVQIFNEAFMRQVHLWGRAYELGLFAEMNLRTGDLTNNLDLGIKMLGKGKVSVLPGRGRPPRNVKPLAGASESVAYYPGCSLHSTGKEYDISTRAVCRALGIRLVEPKGWVCCGSSAAHRADPHDAVRLPVENLALIEKMGFREVTMPCAACFNRHKAAGYELQHDVHVKEDLARELDYRYGETVQVRTLLDTILGHVGVEGLAAQVRQPLDELRIVTYYGCLTTRPPAITEAKNPENPTEMDELLAAAGAEIIDWSYKTSCCGAAHTLTRPDIVLELSGGLLGQARRAGADAVAVACPLCHANLDAQQGRMEIEDPIPVLYFTQLLALALGLSGREAALDKNLVDPRPLLRERGILTPAS